MTAVLQFPPSARESASAVESAKILKASLRRAFPSTAFSVKLSRGTGYGSVHISWTDGPTSSLVEKIAGRFEGQGFDGMTDCSFPKYATLPDGRRSGLRYVLYARHISRGLAMKAAQQIATYFGAPLPTFKPENGRYWALENDNASLQGEYWSTRIHQACADHSRYALEAK